MKRDFNTIRDLLLAIEADKLSEVPFNELQQEHLRLLMSAGFALVGDDSGSRRALAGPQLTPMQLTWKGYEVLDQIRDQELWDTALQVAESLGGVNFEALVALVMRAQQQALKEAAQERQNLSRSN